MDLSEIERATNARNELQQQQQQPQTRNRQLQENMMTEKVKMNSVSGSRQETERHYNYRTGSKNCELDDINNNSHNQQDDSQHNESFVTASFKSNSDFYELSKNSKRWRSMYALRDSIRNLTSCVSTKSSYLSSK